MSTERVVLGRYWVLERVGRGAMGVIYRGLDPVLDREVAIKVMSADFAEEGADAKKRFFREARAAAKLQHRNIVTVFEFAEAEEDGVPYIVMEFLRGSNLAERLSAGPPLTLERKLDIVTELCAGLQYASENGVIHRDVKPANVWLLEDGSVKLVDFGIAKIITATSTLGRDVIGSAAYMSPEQAEGKPVDARTDIFSAAVVLYELVAGVRPFEASTPTATLLKIVQEQPPPITAPDVPATLIAAIGKALAKNPAERYQTAAEFGADLRFIRTSLSTGSDTALSSDSILGSTSTTRETAVRGAGKDGTAGRTATAPAHWPWGRLLLAGLAGALVVTVALYWANVSWLRSKTPPAAIRADAGTGSTPTAPVATNLYVNSEPVGATIIVDGTDTGKATPAAVSFPAGIPKTITLTKPGFKPFEGSVAESDIQRGSVIYQLTAEPPAFIDVQAEADYPFAVLLDGNVISPMGSGLHKLRVPPQRQVKLLAPDVLLDQMATVDAVKRIIPMPGVGWVKFDGREDCVVWHDGVELRNPRGGVAAPSFTTDRIAAGAKTFDFKCKSGKIIPRAQVVITAGGVAKCLVQ